MQCALHCTHGNVLAPEPIWMHIKNLWFSGQLKTRRIFSMGPVEKCKGNTLVINLIF